MHENDTRAMTEEFLKIESPNQCKRFINETVSNSTQYTFASFMNEYIATHPGLTAREIVNNSNIERSYAYHILSGQKKGTRDYIIALCYGAGMTVDETNHALQYANHSTLYVKKKRDSFLIMAINFHSMKRKDFQTMEQLNVFLEENGQAPLLSS